MTEEEKNDQEIEQQADDNKAVSIFQKYGLIGIAAVFGLIFGMGLYPVVFDSCEASEACPEGGEQYGPIMGYHAPLFELADTEGNQYSLKDQRGETAVVAVFEVTTCIWCQRLSEHLEVLRTEYDDVEFWTIDMGEAESSISAFRNAQGIERPWLMDQDGSVSMAYGVSGTPNLFVVDKDGKIAAVQPGYLELDDLRSLLDQAL